MKKQTFTSYKQLWILPMLVIFLFSCNPATEETQIKATGTQRTQVQLPEETSEPITEEVVVPEQTYQTPSKKSSIKATTYKDKEPVEHVEYTISEKNN